MFNPDNVADMENNFEIVNVDMSQYNIVEENESYFEEDPIPSDDNVDDYETVEDEGHGVDLTDPTEVIEPSRKKRRIRKK